MPDQPGLEIILEGIIDKNINARIKNVLGYEVTRNVELSVAIVKLLDICEMQRERIGELTEAVEKKENMDDVVNPSHYNQGGMECIDEMMLIFGPEETKSYCKLNSWKYRKRALFKGTPEKDMAKSDAYLRCYKSIEENGVADFKEGVKHD